MIASKHNPVVHSRPTTAPGRMPFVVALLVAVGVSAFTAAEGLANDTCETAVEAFNGSNAGDNSSSSSAGLDPSCAIGVSSNGIWFFYTATNTGSLLIDTCGTFLGSGAIELDTVLAVYDACGGNELDCSDDCRTFQEDAPPAPCRDEPQAGEFPRDSCVCITVTAGQTVYILIEAFGGDQGPITLNITPNACEGACCYADDTCSVVTKSVCLAGGGTFLGEETTCTPDRCVIGACCDPGTGGCTETSQIACESDGGNYQGNATTCALNPCPPPNDDCANAVNIDPIPATVSGDLLGATLDPLAAPAWPCELPSGPDQNVWYTVVGTGNTMTASLCNTDPDFDTKLAVFCGTCLTPYCVGGDDEGCGFTSLSELEWCSTLGETYYITVGTYSDYITPGPFQLDVADDGTTCSGAVDCIVATGACCVENPPGTFTCAEASENECVSVLAGVYVADGTNCDFGCDCNGNGILDRDDLLPSDPTTDSHDIDLAPGLPIPDYDPINPVPVTHTFTIADGGFIIDLNVDVNITHTYLYDLIITVEHNSTTVTLWNQACSSNADMDVIFDDSGNAVVCNSPTIGTITASSTGGGSLSDFNGMDKQGDWTITVSDNAAGDTGTLNAWSLHIVNASGPPNSMDCNGNGVPDECEMPGNGDFDCDSDVDLDDFARFEACFTGPDGGPIGPGCGPGDFDGDQDVDCFDWEVFVLAWTEPGDPPDFPQCAAGIPTVSGWGMAVMTFALLAAGALVLGRGRCPASLRGNHASPGGKS